jgi:hypothetical protein
MESSPKNARRQEWTIAENLVHISEARQFFTAEVRQALSEPGSRVGRAFTDTGRVQNVLVHSQDSREMIAQKLAASYEQLILMLGQVDDRKS